MDDNPWDGSWAQHSARSHIRDERISLVLAVLVMAFLLLMEAVHIRDGNYGLAELWSLIILMHAKTIKEIVRSIKDLRRFYAPLFESSDSSSIAKGK